MQNNECEELLKSSHSNDSLGLHDVAMIGMPKMQAENQVALRNEARRRNMFRMKILHQLEPIRILLVVTQGLHWIHLLHTVIFQYQALMPLIPQTVYTSQQGHRQLLNLLYFQPSVYLMPVQYHHYHWFQLPMEWQHKYFQWAVYKLTNSQHIVLIHQWQLHNHFVHYQCHQLMMPLITYLRG